MNTEISEVENKIPNTSNLVTTTVLNTKTSEVENKIPGVSGLVKKKTDHAAKIKDTEGKYFSNSDYSKFTSGMFDVKIKKRISQ